MATGTLTTNGSKQQQASAVESNGLSTRQEYNRELSQTSAESAARYEIQGAILIAKQFPRNEDAAFGALMRSCSRQSFAADVTYQFPRGGSTVEGPSVYLAKEAARIWGNIRFGFDIVTDDEDSRHIRGWAWDVETNAKSSYDSHFKKLIQRKNQKTKTTEWITPDERDLRELTNRHGAFLVRNCILDLLPSDLIEDAISKASETLKAKASENVDDSRKKVIEAFGTIGVHVEDLEQRLGHSLSSSSPAEIADLRKIFKSIKDGNSKWSEYVEKPQQTKEPAGPSQTENALTNPSLAEKKDPMKEPEAPAPPETKDPEKTDPPTEPGRPSAAQMEQYGKLLETVKKCTEQSQLDYQAREAREYCERGQITEGQRDILLKMCEPPKDAKKPKNLLGEEEQTKGPYAEGQ